MSSQPQSRAAAERRSSGTDGRARAGAVQTAGTGSGHDTEYTCEREAKWRADPNAELKRQRKGPRTGADASTMAAGDKNGTHRGQPNAQCPAHCNVLQSRAMRADRCAAAGAITAYVWDVQRRRGLSQSSATAVRSGQTHATASGWEQWRGMARYGVWWSGHKIQHAAERGSTSAVEPQRSRCRRTCAVVPVLCTATSARGGSGRATEARRTHDSGRGARAVSQRQQRAGHYSSYELIGAEWSVWFVSLPNAQHQAPGGGTGQ